jgi:hypothetical protein
LRDAPNGLVSYLTLQKNLSTDARFCAAVVWQLVALRLFLQLAVQLPRPRQHLL